MIVYENPRQPHRPEKYDNPTLAPSIFFDSETESAYLRFRNEEAMIEFAVKLLDEATRKM